VRSLFAGVVAAVVVAAAPRPTAADDQVAAPERAVHVPITVGLGLAYVLAEGVFKAPLSADTCRWCDPNGLDDGVRDALRWEDDDLARNLSNYTGYVAAPVFALGAIGLAGHLDGHGTSHWFDDGLIIAESAAIAGVINFAVKAAFARERPFVHDLAPADKLLTDRPQENNQSFYSGHSTLAMSLAVSAGTVASMRGYRWAPALYGGGIGLSLATGYLRIAADKHWASDVVTGWVIGAAIGYAVPRFLHRKGSDLTPTATASTAGVAFTW
jgi:membrane-associated phospholipid phosphatase